MQIAEIAEALRVKGDSMENPSGKNPSLREHWRTLRVNGNRLDNH